MGIRCRYIRTNKLGLAAAFNVTVDVALPDAQAAVLTRIGRNDFFIGTLAVTGDSGFKASRSFEASELTAGSNPGRSNSLKVISKKLSI
jgi:hypothetical protein